MKKAFRSVFLFCILSVPLCCVETIKLTGDFRLSQVLERQDLPISMIADFDFEGDFLYILDGKRGVVLKVKLNSGELVSVISSKGQGPGELENPMEIHVRNEKLYLYDQGFQGIKIFDLNGKLVNSFKVSSNMIFRIRLKSMFAVTDEERLLIVEPSPKTDTLVSEYDARNGNKIRSFIKENLSGLKDRKTIMEMVQCGIRLDRHKNIYVLFYLMNRIRKYSPQGKLIWDERIENEYLKKDRKLNEITGVVVKGKNTRFRPQILGFDLLQDGSIVIQYFGSDGIGGCLLGKEGKLKALFSGGGIQNSMIQIRDERIITCGGIIDSFNTRILPKKLVSNK